MEEAFEVSKACQMKLIHWWQNMGKGKQIIGVNMRWGITTEQGTYYQTNGLAQLLLPVPKHLIIDSSPCVGVKHHT